MKPSSLSLSLEAVSSTGKQLGPVQNRLLFKTLQCMKFKLLIAIAFFTVLRTVASNVKFYSINAMYGISMRETSSLCSDKNGFVWAASKTGILRLSEGDYRIYQLPSASSDYIITRLVYIHSVLFAYTDHGHVFRYNPVADKFDFIVDLHQFRNERSFVVNRLVVDSRGAFWIGSSHGLYRYQYGKMSSIRSDSTNTFMITQYDEEHLLQIGTKGIWMTNMQTHQSRCISNDANLKQMAYSKLFYDKKMERLWVGTVSNGLFWCDMKTGKFNRVLINTFPRQPVLAIEANSDSTLMVGIDGQGIWELNRKADKVLNIYKEDADNAASLRGDGVYDIFCDPKKRVWACSYTGGVCFFDQTMPLVNQITHNVNNPNSLTNNRVNKIIEDKKGNIWMATDNGISRWEMKTNSWKTFYNNKKEQAQVFLSICEDNNGRIWAGTYSSGVYVLDANTGKELFRYSPNDSKNGLGGSFIFDIKTDSQGDIWIGGVRGEIICYFVKENKFRTYSEQPLYVYSELSPGKMLLACSNGLTLLDKKTGEEETLLEGYIVHDLAIVGNDAWICSRGDGLIRFDLKSHKIEKFTTKSGIPSNYVNSVVRVGDYLWLGTERGMCKFNPKDKSVITYSSLFSLSQVAFNHNSHCTLKNGDLMWGTGGGVVMFNPKAIQEVKLEGKIFLQDLTVSGRSIRDSSIIKLTTPLDSLKDISLKYDQNTLTLELLPLGISAADAKFSWKMEGLDANWTQAVNHKIITYTNLPSGNFKLRIRMYDSSMSRVISEREIRIHINPPFWRAWWFLFAVIWFILGIVYFSLKYYLDHLKQVRTAEKVRFFTNTAHDMRTSLTLINAPIEELSKERNLTNLGKFYLELAKEQVRRLTAMSTQLMDFQKVDVGKERLSLKMTDIVKLVEHRKLMYESLAKSKKIEIVFSSDQSQYLSAVDESMMDKVVDNLISNAIKYSPSDSQIQIILRCGKMNWMLEVKDQGIGISKKAQRQLFKEFYRAENAINSKIVGSGIGLLLVKNYVNLHKGTISCVSKEDAGASFEIIIPFREVPVQEAAPTSSEELAIPLSIMFAEPEEAPQQETKPRGIKVLIVEDNDDLRTFMQFPLREKFDVLTAEDGVQAWEIIQKQMPDLIISDIMMPKMDGFELCRLVKSTYETSHIPLILLTALSGKAEQLHGLGLGAEDYLTKPFDMTLLTQRIKSIIRNRDIVREKARKLIKADDSGMVFTNELNDKFVKKALLVVRENISNPEFGKDEFASAMNVSSSLLYKKVKTLTDQSPVEFIKTVKLDYSIELLQSRKYTITEVSILSGFASVGYFSTVFKKHFGKSPTEILG